MGGKTVIMGVAVEDDKTTSFDIKTDDFTSPSFFPWNTNHGQNVINGFIAENRLKDLAGLFKINILQKLIPGLNKTGYTEEQSTTSNTAPSRRYPLKLQN
jgi:proteasome inhibitor subunit 1 (PI31)